MLEMALIEETGSFPMGDGYHSLMVTVVMMVIYIRDVIVRQLVYIVTVGVYLVYITVTLRLRVDLVKEMDLSILDSIKMEVSIA